MSSPLSRRRVLLSSSAALAVSIASRRVRAQADPTWPTRPVTLVVPFPPGGGTDVSARTLAERLSALLGKPFVIENRPGATGNIGNDLVAHAAPDGYTVLVQGTIIGMFPHIFPKLGYDPLKDLKAICTVAESPTVLVVDADTSVRSLRDLVTAGKADGARPLNYGSAGIGSPQHLAAEQFARAIGLSVQHVAYRGSTPAINDLMGRQIDFGVFSLSSVLPLITGRKLRALALMSRTRSSLLPEVATTAELGYPAVDSSIRFALFVPAGTPSDVIARLASANNRAIAEPQVKAKFAALGYEVVTSTPAEASAMVVHESELWRPIVKELGLKLE